MTITQRQHADGIMSQVIRHTESAFRVEQQDENRFAITTPFIYPYDDPIILYLSYAADGCCIISDRGDANHWLNEVNGFESDRALTPDDCGFWDLNCEMYETRRTADNHLQTDADPGNIGPAAFRLIQTIIHILGPEPRYDD